ncbi:hypothetical protein [Paenibacillus wenxiniae]|uniref:XkdX family protein n=1 Tax=Paenibacillus wenxiniae TaxID=1636843 RepID=A0ABW4RCV7_9BACL
MTLQNPNMWTVLEYMTQMYMRTGSPPCSQIVRSDFSDTELDVITDGECAFYELIGELP